MQYIYDLSLSTVYHSQSDREMEHVNQEAETYLQIFCGTNTTSWPKMISHAELTHNHHPHSITNKSPFFLMMGFKPCPLPTIISHSSIPTIEDHLKSLVTAQDEALTAHDLALQVMKSHFHGKFNPFTKGEKVWLEARNLKCCVSNPKFAPKREEPFTIMDVPSPLSYRLHLPHTWKIHLVFHTTLLSPYHENETHRVNFPAPPPDLIDREEEYGVEKILKHQGPPTNHKYLIWWRGYSTEEDSWLPEMEFKNAPATLKAYKTSHSSAFSPLSLSPKSTKC